MRLLDAMKSVHLTILTYSKERWKVFVAYVQILLPRNAKEKKVREKGWISDSHHCFRSLKSRRGFCTPGSNRSTCGAGLAENHLRRVFNSQVPGFLAPLRLLVANIMGRSTDSTEKGSHIRLLPRWVFWGGEGLEPLILPAGPAGKSTKQTCRGQMFLFNGHVQQGVSRSLISLSVKGYYYLPRGSSKMNVKTWKSFLHVKH